MLPLKNLRRIAKHAALCYSEVQSKTRFATSNDSQAPSSKQMDELLRMSYRADLCDELMDTLFKRLEERGKSWRHVHKALLVVDHLLYAGSERTLSYCVSHIATIQALRDYTFFDANNIDRGTNVRFKANHVLSALSDLPKLTQKRLVRPHACSNMSWSPSTTSTNSLRRKVSMPLLGSHGDNENASRREEMVSKPKLKRSEDAFDSVILIIDRNTGGVDGAPREYTDDGSLDPEPVSTVRMDAVLEKEQEADSPVSPGSDDSDERRAFARTSPRMSSLRSLYTQSTWSLDDDHQEVVRPSAPTPGLSPTSEYGDSSMSSSTNASIPSSPMSPLKSMSPTSPSMPLTPCSPLKTSGSASPLTPSNTESPHKPVRPLPSPPRRPSVESEVDEAVATVERLKALRKLHSALPLAEEEISKIMSTQNIHARKMRPLPTLPSTLDFTNPFVSVCDYFPPAPTHLPQRARIR